MEMKKRLWNLHFGNKKINNFLKPQTWLKPSLSNKGFIFSLDVTIAVIIVMSLIIASTFYVSKAGSESVSKLQTIRIGADVLASLDYDGTLDTLSKEDIESELEDIVPVNTNMKIAVSCNGDDPVVAKTGDDPLDRFVGSGKRVFVTDTGTYCIAQYSIWLK